MPRIVVLDNARIDAMDRERARFAEFAGCLDLVRNAQPVPGCKRCGRASGKDASVYNAARLCIVGMPQEARDRLKRMLGADTLRLVAPRNGRVETFDV